MEPQRTQSGAQSENDPDSGMTADGLYSGEGTWDKREKAGARIS